MLSFNKVGDKLYNIREYNINNRWIYSTRSDKSKFVSIMHIISLAVLLEFLIFEAAADFIYNFLIYDLGFFQSDFAYLFSPDELHYIFYNIASVLLTLTASSITIVFLIFCLRNLVFEQSITVRDKISYKFKFPKNTAPLLAMGLLIIQLSLILSEVFNYFLYYFFGIGLDRSFDYLYFPETIFGVILYFFTIVIMPAFIEEFIFRYIMLNALKKYGNTFAIITTSLLFGFLHARTSAIFYATAIGFFTAYIAIKTRSIWFSIILHAIVNATSFFFQYVAVQPITDAEYDIIYFSFISVISIISLIYTIILIRKKKNLKLSLPGNYTHIENKRKLMFFFNAAAIIFFILVIIKSAGDYGFAGMPDINI